MIIGVILINRKPMSSGNVSDSSSDDRYEAAEEAIEPDDRQVDQGNIESPVSQSAGAQKDGTYTENGSQAGTVAEESFSSEEKETVALIDVLSKPLETEETAFQESYANETGDLIGEPEVYIEAPFGDIEEIDPQSGRPSDHSQSATGSESKSAETETKTQESKTDPGSGEPSGEVSGETETSREEPSVTESSETTESGDNETKDSQETSGSEEQTEPSAEEQTVPPTPLWKTLVAGTDSVTVPVAAPEELAAFDNLPSGQKYELALQFDSVSAYNEYIAFLRKVADIKRSIIDGDAEIE